MNETVIAIIVERIQSHLNSAVIKEFSSIVFREPVSHLLCRDGTRISVQAGRHLYSSPKKDQGPWTHVEVMIEADPIYFERDDAGIAGYVPIELVAQEVLARGNFIIDYD